MEMGVDAIVSAVADAGIAWKDVQFATGGSWTVANPDAIVAMVGLTGIPFTNVFTRARTAPARPKCVPTGSGWRLRHRHRLGLDSTHAGRSPKIRRWWACEVVCGRTGSI